MGSGLSKQTRRKVSREKNTDGTQDGKYVPKTGDDQREDKPDAEPTQIAEMPTECKNEVELEEKLASQTVYFGHKDTKEGSSMFFGQPTLVKKRLEAWVGNIKVLSQSLETQKIVNEGQLEEDKTTVLTFENGSEVLISADGRTRLEEIVCEDGSKRHIRVKDGATVMECPDGTFVQVSKNGDIVEHMPDGTKLSVARQGRMVMLESPDGSKEARDLASGSTKYTMANGTIVRIASDNLRVETRPDGSEHTEFVNIDEAGVTLCTYIVKDTAGKITTTTLTSHGFRVITYSDGRMMRYNSDGTTMEKLPDGTILQTLADGSILRNRPNATTERLSRGAVQPQSVAENITDEDIQTKVETEINTEKQTQVPRTKRKRRTHARIKEIYKTESQFLDCMRFMSKFKDKPETKSVLTATQINAILPPVDHLVRASETFLGAINTNWVEVMNREDEFFSTSGSIELPSSEHPALAVCEKFVECVEDLEAAFKRYIPKYAAAYGKFTEMLKDPALTAQQRHVIMPLSHRLIVPVQRACRYHLLFTALIDAYPTLEGHAGLQAALEAAKRMATSCNDMERQGQVEILLERLPSLGQYIRPHGNEQGLALIKSEPMSRIGGIMKQKAECKLFLFSGPPAGYLVQVKYSGVQSKKRAKNDSIKCRASVFALNDCEKLSLTKQSGNVTFGLKGPMKVKLTSEGRSTTGHKSGKYQWSVNQQAQRMHGSVIDQKIQEWDRALASVMQTT